MKKTAYFIIPVDFGALFKIRPNEGNHISQLQSGNWKSFNDRDEQQHLPQFPAMRGAGRHRTNSVVPDRRHPLPIPTTKDPWQFLSTGGRDSDASFASSRPSSIGVKSRSSAIPISDRSYQLSVMCNGWKRPQKRMCWVRIDSCRTFYNWNYSRRWLITPHQLNFEFLVLPPSACKITDQFYQPLCFNHATLVFLFPLACMCVIARVRIFGLSEAGFEN